MFSAIQIQNFRGFSNVDLSNLGLVNLIVGRNNTGKTSLLEAISILANREKVRMISGFFRANLGRGEQRFSPWLIRDTGNNDYAQVLGRDEQGEGGVAIRIGDNQRPWPEGISQLTMFPEVSTGVIKLQREPPVSLSIVSVHQRTPEDIAAAFARAVRSSEGESQMEALLRSVDNRIKTVRLDYENDMGSHPFIVVDIGLSRKVPLSEVGQGMYRLITIFSDLLAQRPNLCNIDEIENGIHHSALPQLWKGVAQVAEKFQIQIFATTHSGECLAAAHEVFKDRQDYDLRVIQLFRKNGCVEGRVLDRELIEVGLEGNIDLR